VCAVHSGVIRDPVAVSIGSRGDTSFEKDLYDRLGAIVHTYDPTMLTPHRKGLAALPFLTFHDAGLSGRKYINTTRRVLPPQFRNATLLTVPRAPC